MNGKIESLRNYILITCCKNEGKNLYHLINSIALQTIRPTLWIIIDDGSTDNTDSIIEEAKGKHSWIRNIQLKNNINYRRDLGLHLAGIIKGGFEQAILYCREKKLDYNYMGNVDGDLILEKTFFENLILEFEKDSQLGIASGDTMHMIDQRLVRHTISVNEPSGGHMLIRRECFEECNRIPISYSWDSVLKAKARLKGWKTVRFDKNIATEIRDVGAAEGHWSGSFQHGKSDYYINYNPIHIFIKGIRLSFKKPNYMGIAYILGYINDFLRRKDQIEDSEIKNYFWNKWKKYL